MSRNGRRARSEVFDQEPPNDREAERRVIKALICKPQWRDPIAGILGPEHFHFHENAILYSHLLRMEQVDECLLVARLKEAGQLDAAGGVAHLAEIMRATYDTIHPDGAADIVRKLAFKRSLIHVGSELVKAGYDPRGDPEEAHRQAIDLLGAPDRKNPKQRFQLLSPAELDALDCSADYVVRDVLAKGAATVLGGAFKCLKTSVGIDLLFSLATQVPFLGHFEVLRPARAVYFCGEGGWGFVQDVARRVAAAKGLALSDFTQKVFCNEIPNLDQAEHLDALSQILVGEAVEFCFLDPLFLGLGDASAEAGNVYGMGRRLNAVNQACLNANSTPVILHHFKRAREANSPACLADLSQAGVAEYSGTWLLLSRQRPYDEERPGAHSLWLTLGSRLGHSSKWSLDVQEGTRDAPGGRYWQPQVTIPSEARQKEADAKERQRDEQQQAALDRNVEKIVRAMVHFPDGESKTAIRDMAGVHPRHFGPAFSELLRTGQAVACRVRKENRGFDGYKLVVE